MGYNELEERGLFLSEEAREEHTLKSSVNRPVLIGVAALGFGGGALMPLGGGGTLTWIGTAAFVAFMWLFAVVSAHGVDRQNERLHQLRGEVPEPE